MTIAIEKERREGAPICATSSGNTAGYFLAANQEEMQSYCDRLKHREREIAQTRAACMKTIAHLPALPGQPQQLKILMHEPLKGGAAHGAGNP